MRVLFWKFHCPSFICCCKSSPISFSSPCSLESGNTQDASSSLPSVPDAVVGESSANDEKKGVDGVVEEIPPAPLKSSLKKPSRSSSKEIEKGKVQWTDFLGTELVEIREFEPSESGESEDDLSGGFNVLLIPLMLIVSFVNTAIIK